MTIYEVFMATLLGIPIAVKIAKKEKFLSE